jgi:hypothetical protein
MCLEDAAHGVVPSHAIFNEPLKVNLAFEERPTPANYFELSGDRKLEKTIQVWPVQTKKYPEIDPGLVSNPYGFRDSPDAEVISSGLNSKGPDSVALARHGNFFLWGFAASPRDMTPDGRNCFVNSVCYIRRYDGQKPVARKAGLGFTRDGALLYANYLRHIFDEDAFKNGLPHTLRDDPEQYARYREAVLRGFEMSYPEEIRRRFGHDPEKYIGWVKDNLEYLRFEVEDDDARLQVDEEVKALGLSNRRVELLDKCISMLEQRDRSDKARRILKRYTTEDFSDAKGWRTWLDANRGRLFFSDVGGFKFLVAPEPLAWAASRPEGAETREPDAGRPVVAEAELSPSKAEAGEALNLVVRVKIAPTWHIYSAGGSGGPGIPTTLKLKLPKGVEPEGEWTHPESIPASDGQKIYEGSVEFRRKLRVDRDAARGTIRVTCEFGYQACDPRSCQPPTRVEVEAKSEVIGPGPR